MKIFLKLVKSVAVLVFIGLSFGIAKAEDIDVFIGGEVNSAIPNVIFILDNTANWSGNDQQFGEIKQGQAEVRAIKTALASMVDDVNKPARFNVGLMEFTTEVNANKDGGFVRFDLQALTPSAYDALSKKLTKIYDDFDKPTEKRSANTPYGNLMYDLYNYLGGFDQSYKGAGTNANNADALGYTERYSKFSSPLVSDNLCSNTYLIFIGNPNSNGPTPDSKSEFDSSAQLKLIYAALGDTPDRLSRDNDGTPLPLPRFSTVINTKELGTSTQCYKSNQVEQCTLDQAVTGGLCEGASGCGCTAKAASCSNNESKYSVTLTTTEVKPDLNSFDTVSGAAWDLDDWSKFLNNYGVPVTTTVADSSDTPVEYRVKVKSFMIDVFNAKQNAQTTSLFLSAADVGGGRYFAARNEDAIVDAINSALSDILSVSATFSAATLPLSASNRSQSDNEVYIGMFRPYSEPRWFGNLKRYKVGLVNNTAELVDVNGESAVNNLTGFLAECAKSYWTLDKGNYWEALKLSPPPLSQCTKANIEKWADSPDGPFVEKGGAAQVSRYSDLTKRKVLTVSGSSLAAVTAASLGGSDTLLGYLKGTTGGAEESLSSGAAVSAGRPSIHGDVIHSRPFPINYGGATGTVLFYGANDGLFRAVKGADGTELWSLIAQEHLGNDLVRRLYNNSPRIAFPNADTSADPAPTPKDYFFDGSVGQLVSYAADNTVTSAYIYPTMRRGGRMIYALNVTNPGSPSLLWKRGCPNPGNDTAGCDSGFEAIGQTWSTPQSANLAGYNSSGTSLPVVIFGGGYDSNCLDPDAATLDCTSATGKSVYVLDATTGESLTKKLATDAPVVGDIALADVNFDGKTDFAYAADAAGSLWRINFSSMDNNGVLTALDKNNWTITKVASTEGDNRRFLNGPAVAVYKNSVYVTLGSGNRERQLKSNYPYQTQVDDRFYVFLDSPGASSSAVDLDGNLMLNSVAGSNCGATGIYPGSSLRGWYYDLAGRGEQVINPSVIDVGKVFFNSYQPGGDRVGVCTGPQGIATGYSASLFKGACEITTTSTIGPPPIPPTIPPPVCIANCDSPNPTIITVCIGCEPGLAPSQIEPTVNQVRRKVYWKTDVDR